MQGVGMDDLGPLPGNEQNIALCRVKLHQPVLLPLFKLLEVILEPKYIIAVIYGTNGVVNYCVICEEPDLGETCIFEVIDEQEEEDRSENRPLRNTIGDWHSF